MIRLKSTLVEEVRDLPSLASAGERGRMKINSALELVADKYRLSNNPEDYEFIVLRAVYANEPNVNGDAFPLEELKRFDRKYGCRVYQTFILKPHFIEHKQDGEPYGFVLDAHIEEPKDECAYVELIIAVDKKKDPVYAMEIKSKRKQKYSMGCTVGYTVCKVCKNRAVTEDDFCEHIARGKMQEFKVADEQGQEQKVLAFEDCFEVCYDEISKVGDPAEIRAEEEERLTVQSKKKFSKQAASGGCPSDLKAQEYFDKHPGAQNFWDDMPLKNKQILAKEMGLGWRWDIDDYHFCTLTKEDKDKVREYWKRLDREYINPQAAVTKISRTNEEFIQMFLENSFPKDKMPNWGTENLRIAKDYSGWVLENYGTPLLYRANNDIAVVWFNHDKYSKTTSVIQNKIRYMAQELGVALKEVDGKDMPVKGGRIYSNRKADGVPYPIPAIAPKPRNLREEKTVGEFRYPAKLRGLPLNNEDPAYEISSGPRITGKGKNASMFGKYDTVRLLSTGAVGMVEDVIKDLYQGGKKFMVRFPGGSKPYPVAAANLELVKRGRVRERTSAKGATKGPRIAQDVEPESDWQMNLAKDINDSKIVKDETAMSTWFKARYHRDPKPEEQDKMKNLVGAKKAEIGNEDKSDLEHWFLADKIDNLNEHGYEPEEIAAILFKQYPDHFADNGLSFKELTKRVRMRIKHIEAKKAEIEEKNSKQAHGLQAGKEILEAGVKDYHAWRLALRRRGYSGDEINTIEKMGVTKGLWELFDKPDSVTAEKAESKSRVINRKNQGGRKMAVEFAIKGFVDPKKVRFAKFRDWKVQAIQTPKGRIMRLGNGKLSYALKADSKVDAQKLAESVLDDLVMRGLQFTLKKYAFTPRFKSITQEGLTDKGEIKPQFGRLTEDGTSDKKDYKPDRFVDKDSIGALELDREEKDPKPYTGKTSPKLGERKPLVSRRRPLISRHKGAVKYNAAKLGERKPLVSRRRPLISRHKGAVKYNAAKLVKALVELVKKYRKVDARTAQSTVLKAFVKDPKVRTKLSMSRLADDAIMDNVKHIDVPGLVEEVSDFFTTEQEMTPAEATDAIVEQFVDEKAPEKVVDAITEEVKDLTEGAGEGKEEKAPEEGKSPEEKEVSEVKDKVDKIEEEAPSMAEMGIEELDIESSKKAKDLNTLYQKKLLRALNLSARRQLLNQDKSGLFEIKAIVMDQLITPSGRFAGLSSATALAAMERATNQILGSKALDELFASAIKLAEMPDEAFVQIEEDIKNLGPAGVVTSGASNRSASDVGVFNHTGTGLDRGQGR